MNLYGIAPSRRWSWSGRFCVFECCPGDSRMLKNAKWYRCSSELERSWVCLSTSTDADWIYAFDYVGCAWTFEPVFEIASESACLEVLWVNNGFLNRGSFQRAVMIYWALRGWVVAWEFLENCVSLSWRLIPVDLYPSMPASKSASSLASAVLGIVVGIWFWTFWVRKGMDLAQCVYVVYLRRGEVRLERGLCSTLMRNDEWDFHWSRDVWAMGNNDSDEVVNPWVVWSRAVSLSGGARTVNGERRCRFRFISVFLQALGEWWPMVLLCCCDVKEEERERREVGWGSCSVVTAVLSDIMGNVMGNVKILRQVRPKSFRTSSLLKEEVAMHHLFTCGTQPSSFLLIFSVSPPSISWL